MEWEPSDHHEDPTVNALLNIAESISNLAAATNGLLYGLKYSKDEGMSLAEAVEKSISEGLQGVASAIEAHDPVGGDIQPIADALSEGLDDLSVSIAKGLNDLTKATGR
jgi:hypothetical protein